MIDMTFLLLVFFLVTQAAAQISPVELPGAKHGTGVSESNGTVIVLAAGSNQGPVRVFRGDSLDEPLPDSPEAQESGVREYVEQGLAEERTEVIVKADRQVRYRDVARIAAAAARVDGVKINLAVLEED
jgi:biopolymer transport protein ExbD